MSDTVKSGNPEALDFFNSAKQALKEMEWPSPENAAETAETMMGHFRVMGGHLKQIMRSPQMQEDDHRAHAAFSNLKTKVWVALSFLVQIEEKEEIADKLHEEYQALLEEIKQIGNTEAMW